MLLLLAPDEADMITVSIGEEEHSLQDATEQWINQQIQRRRADNQAICVRVSIRQGDLDMVLATPSCNGAGSGGRTPNANELEVFRLWRERGLREPDFSGGSLIAFLAQLKRSFS
jgi:hypothetical protein